MKKISRKLVFSIIALFSIFAFSMLSFSLADENNGASENTVVAAANNDYTQIDRIIENSHTGIYGDKNYNILEITSGANSSFKSMCDNTGFKKYVIDGYKSIDQLMADGTVKYVSYSVSTDDDTLVDAIQKADLVYLHNDPDKMFSNSNDVSEAVKLALSSAATADYKPFIIDSYNGTINNKSQAKNYNSLVSRTFNSSMATFGWPVTGTGIESIANFMGMKVSSATYSRINGRNASAVWQKFKYTDDETKSYTMAKVLTIGDPESGYDMTAAMKVGLSHEDPPTNLSAADQAVLKDKNVLKFVSTSDLYTYGYVKAYSHPNYIKFEKATSVTALSSYDLSSYDFIILESSLNNQLPDAASYNALSAAAYAKVHILYSPSLKTMSNSQNSKENPAPGYAYVLNKLATPSDVSRFDNVLVTNFAKMDIYSNANNSRTVKDIADIIINGSFRGIQTHGGDDTSNVYTVLEIEPSYPIDTNLAKVFYDKKTYDLRDTLYTYDGGTRTFYNEGYPDNVIFGKYGETSFYYLRTNGVLDATADEISYDGVTPLSAYDGDQTKIADAINGIGNVIDDQGNDTKVKDTSKICDYYNWKLSQAKIAHAVGKAYNQVKVVHMSSAEFNTSRLSLLDTYDAIYIGGDTSGIKFSNKWDNKSKYNMYYRDGDNNAKSSPGGDSALTTSNGTFRSNDISDSKRLELIKYSKTLPIIVDKNVVDAITNKVGVDPQSNMYKAIDAAKSASKSLWNFDSTQTCRITNSDGEYGNTYGGYVTIFKGTETEDYKGEIISPVATGTVAEKELRDTLQGSMRPKIVLSSMPKKYVETDSKTWITKNDFVWKYEIKDASNVTIKVLYDEDGNGRFDESSEVKANGSGATGTVSMPADSFDDNFFGPVYWKFIAINNDTGASVSTTNISKVKRTEESKMKVNLLQIFPETSATEPGDACLETLLFCTECQQSRGIVRNGNISTSTNSGKYGSAAIEQKSGRFGAQSTISNISDGATNTLKFEATNTYYPDRSQFSIELKDAGSNRPFRDSANNPTSSIGQVYINLGSKIVYDNLPNGTYHLEGKDNQSSVTVVFGEDSYSLKQNDKVDIVINDSTSHTITVSYTKSGREHFITEFLTNDDSTYKYSDHGNVLGIHDHKFGIVKYDDHETRTQTKGAEDKQANDCDYEGLDNWNTNWFLDFQNDYDVDMTLLSTREFEAYCAKVNNAYKNTREKKYDDLKDADGNVIKSAFELKKDALANDRLTYSQNETKYETLYKCMVSVINNTYYSSNSGLTNEEKTTFETYLKDTLKIGGVDKGGSVLDYTTTPDDSSIKTMLQAYGSISGTIDKYLLKNIDNLYSSGKMSCTYKQAKSELEWLADANTLPDDKSYYYFFSLWSDTDAKTDEFAKYYVTWRDAKILEQYFHEKYIENKIMASVYCGDNATETNIGTFDLSYAFNCVVLGSAETFGKDDINVEGCNVLHNYCVNYGHVILFHDSLSVEGAGGSGTKNMTSILRDDFGQAGVSDSATQKTGYSVTQKTAQYNAKGHEDQAYYTSINRFGYFDYETESNNQTLHGSHDVRDMIENQEGHGVSSDKANQVNEGIVTEYPFTIGSTLKISPTCPAGFTANTDDQDVIVYYCISGGSLGSYSKMFTANPNDGANNYFLYQYKNVTYTGAGHSLITGLGRNNNDERRLFINVILNSARRSTGGPSLTLHDIDSTDDDLKNNVIKDTYDASTEGSNVADTEEYVTYVDSKDATREFTFRPVSNNGIRTVKIWFDVVNNDSTNEKNIYNSEENTAGKKDILIYTIENTSSDANKLKNNGIESKKVKKIYNGTGVDADQGDVKLEGYVKQSDGKISTNLKLSEDYFTGQGGKCAYICVEITDNNGKVAEKTIRVETKPELIDLN